RARLRVVHRDYCIAVARDPAAIAEGCVERLSDGERGVLRGVVVACLEVALSLHDQVEPGVEAKLLEEVVVDAGSRRDAHAARTVEREPDGDSCLGRGAHGTNATAARLRNRRGTVEDACRVRNGRGTTRPAGRPRR